MKEDKALIKIKSTGHPLLMGIEQNVSKKRLQQTYREHHSNYAVHSDNG